MDVNFETDKLLQELGIASGGGSSSVSVKSQPPAAPGAPAPPPPPPPPPPPAASAKISGSAIKRPKPPATKEIQDAKAEIDDLFDSVISFAGKTSSKRGKTPPPVAPKPKRKIHVSSYTMQVKSGGGSSGAQAKAEPVPSVPNFPPKPPPVVAKTEPSVRKPSEGGIVPSEQPPIALTAFGPGLETFEVNSFGHFQVSCPHDTTDDDLEIVVTGPTGTKPVEIDDHGNGQFSCSYIPTSAGEHTVSIKVKGKPIPGSPFSANVQFAAYTDKCSAEGPGLESGTTSAPCHFTIKCKEDAGYARLRVHILGPSRAEPIEMTENPEDRTIGVVYHPSAAGDYTIRVLWGEAHVRGSPFNVPVSGDTVNDPSRVKVTGDGLKGGHVHSPLKFFVEGEAGAGPGPLGVRMVGPSKPTITADDSSDDGVEVTFVCRDPGEYQLILKWGTEELPNSPWTINIGGEGRASNAKMCTASGSGVELGTVGQPASFTINIPDEAGPGNLNVSVSGPHPPKPIEIVNTKEGTMQVTYHPVCPGEYKIECMWANDHIDGSPFTAVVTGLAVRNAKAVHASGEVLSEGLKCNQLGTISVKPEQPGAGPGPLRAKLEGPAKAELQLSSNPDGTLLVSFVPKEPGTYKLHLLWGDAENEDNEISGSPFSLKVEKN